jgi:ribosomal protein S18 acetylase RimI-like enzyme
MVTATKWAIRTAGQQDHDAVLQLWASLGMSGASEAEWRAISSGASTRSFVAEDEGRVVGTAIAAYDGWRAYIYHVGVEPSARSMGLGRALMAEAEEYLRRQGARRVYVEVHEENTPGIALCTASGYEPEGDIALVKELAG